jgi:hypothetical protein
LSENSRGKGKDHLGDVVISERLCQNETRNEYVKWLHLAQERVQWEALENTVMNFGFHKWHRISKKATDSQKLLCSLDLILAHFHISLLTLQKQVVKICTTYFNNH